VIAGSNYFSVSRVSLPRAGRRHEEHRDGGDDHQEHGYRAGEQVEFSVWHDMNPYGSEDVKSAREPHPEQTGRPRDAAQLAKFRPGGRNARLSNPRVKRGEIASTQG